MKDFDLLFLVYVALRSEMYMNMAILHCWKCFPILSSKSQSMSLQWLMCYV